MGAHARHFVDLYADAMPGAVTESLHTPIELACLETFLHEKLLHLFVDFAPIGFVAHIFQRDFLPAGDGVVDPPQPFGGAAFDNGARNIAEVTGFLRTWKDVDND